MVSLEDLENLEGYSRHFMDAELWSPFIHKIWRSSKLGHINRIVPGLAGTFPTFIVDERWVIKFFGRLFDGATSWAVERICAVVVQDHRPFPIPSLLAHGEIKSVLNTPWYYLIFECIPGISIGQVLEDISYPQKLQLASWLGKAVRSLHQTTITQECVSVLPQQSEILANNRLNCVSRHQEWQSLPKHLIFQIEPYLSSNDFLWTKNIPIHIIHADLTRDHLLGSINPDGWFTNAIIDFGDAMLGGLDYELIALYFDLFQGDKSLLAAFLDSYGIDINSRKELSLRAMRATLLFNFDILQCLPVIRPEKSWSTLEALALDLWDTTTT
jgi:hypothetical protein